MHKYIPVIYKFTQSSPLQQHRRARSGAALLPKLDTRATLASTTSRITTRCSHRIYPGSPGATHTRSSLRGSTNYSITAMGVKAAVLRCIVVLLRFKTCECIIITPMRQFYELHKSHTSNGRPHCVTEEFENLKLSHLVTVFPALRCEVGCNQ